MKEIIELELKWCEEHRGMKSKDFEEGFIAGLKQAIFLIEAAATTKRMDESKSPKKYTSANQIFKRFTKRQHDPAND